MKEQFVLSQPLSPHHAARIDQVSIQASDFTVPALDHSIVVEGAGGVFVPINEKETMLDLMMRFKLPVILVARSGLGTLNHTLLSLEALRFRNIDVCGVVMVGDKNPKNKETIQQMGSTEIIAEIPRAETVDRLWLEQTSKLLPPTPPRSGENNV